MLYDGLTMIDMIGASHKNKVYFLEVSIQYKQVSEKMGLICFNTINKFFTFVLACFTRNQLKITQFVVRVEAS